MPEFVIASVKRNIWGERVIKDVVAELPDLKLGDDLRVSLNNDGTWKVSALKIYHFVTLEDDFDGNDVERLWSAWIESAGDVDN